MKSKAVDLAAVYGVWHLTAATAVDAEGRSLAMPYGPVPQGALVLTKSGRMLSVVCDGRVNVPENEQRAYSSYCGSFKIEGNLLTTTVDAAAIRERIGTKQVREVEIRDGRLILRPPPRPDGEQRELVWNFSGPA